MVELLWWHWIALGMVLMGMEIFLTSFTILWFGLGAVIVGAILYFAPSMEVSLQVFLWAIFSIIFTFSWFKVINPMIRDKSLSGMAKEALIGQTGMVIIAPVEGKRGRLRFPTPILGSDEWEFICEVEVKAGDRVIVSEHSGNTLLVRPHK